MRTLSALERVGFVETKTQQFNQFGWVPPSIGMPGGPTEQDYWNDNPGGQNPTACFTQGTGNNEAGSDLRSAVFTLGSLAPNATGDAKTPYSNIQPGAEIPLHALEIHKSAYGDSAVNSGWKGMIGKDIFLRNIFLRMELQMQMGGSKNAPWSVAQGPPVTSQSGPQYYQPQRFRVIVVKLKRDTLPPVDPIRMGGEIPTQCRQWQPMGCMDNEQSLLVGQTHVNTRLFVGLNSDFFGLPLCSGSIYGATTPTSWKQPYETLVGSTQGDQGIPAHMYFDQPIARKYWDVLSDKKFTLGCLPVAAAAPDWSASVANVAYPFPASGMANANTPSYRTLKLNLPFNSSVEMCDPLTGQPPNVGAAEGPLQPADLNLYDVKVIVLHKSIHTPYQFGASGSLTDGPALTGQVNRFNQPFDGTNGINNMSYTKDAGACCQIRINGTTSYTDS